MTSEEARRWAKVIRKRAGEGSHTDLGRSLCFAAYYVASIFEAYAKALEDGPGKEEK